MKKFILAIGLCLWATIALAQAPMCPDQPNGTSNNTCANTRFVINNAGGGSGSPGGNNGDIQYNNAGVFGGLPQVTVPKGGTGGTTYTTGNPVLGAGTGAMTSGTRSGNTTVFGTTTGTLTNGHCISIDASGNLIDSGAACSPATVLGVCDVINITGATSITSGAAILTVTGANFQTTDVGKVIAVPGAGAQVAGVGGTLVAVIQARSSTTQITLDRNAGTTLSAVSKTVTYGTDDTAAFQTAIADATTGYISFASATGCMITDAIPFPVAKTFTASPTRSTLYYRQLAGTTFKPMIDIGVDGVYLRDFSINADPGGVVTSATKDALIEVRSKSIRIDNLYLYGNKSALNQPIMGAIGAIGSNSFITNNIISNFATFPIQGACGQSHILISGNKMDHGPKLANGNGFISFLCSSTAAIQGDIRVHANSIDMSDLSVADMNVGIYFFGNSNASFFFNQLAISDNVIIGTSGATASTTGGIILIQAGYASITGNVINHTGECIGSGANNATITGNVLVGCGTYGIELSGANVTVTGNSIDSEAQTPYGMSVGNCQQCTISNNTLLGVSGPSGYTGLFVYTPSGGTSYDVAITGNSISLPSTGTTYGIRLFVTAGSTTYLNYNVVGNIVGGGGLNSTGISAGGTATNQYAFLIGPNSLGQNLGVDVGASFASFCYVKGVNRSTTATSGAAFPGTCN